jgi:hypothetical protein
MQDEYSAGVLELAYPIERKGEEPLFELRFRRLKGKDLKKTPNDSIEKMFCLVARLTGHTPSVIEELDADDLGKAQKIVEGFLKSFLPTGDSSTDG